MNILFIARGVPNKQDPQWGSFELSQAKALSAAGHHVIIASVDMRLRRYWRKRGITEGDIDGIKTYNLYIIPAAIAGVLGNRFKQRVTAWLWHKLESTILQKEKKIDIIYTHYLPNTYRAVHYLQNIHAPIVAIEHWSEVNQPTLRPDVQRMGDDAYARVDRIISVSKAARNSILRHFGKDSVVVYNMVDSCFTYAATDMRKESDKFVFTAVGNLLPIKGYDTLVKAMAQLSIPRDKWELRIIGHGSERKHLEELLARHNLQQNILLLGQKNTAQVQQQLSCSDAFVLASRSETFGVAYIEAMACGLPVIATRCGGPEEFVTEQNGLLVPVDDVDALTKAIEYMFEHYDQYNRQAIAEDCKKRFSPEIIAEQLTGIFKEIVEK